MIRIEHSSNPLNYGTNMMVTNFMYYLDKYSNTKNSYELDVYNDEDLNNYRNQYKEANLTRKTIDYSLTYSNNIFEKVMNKLKRKIAFDYFYNNKVKELKRHTKTLIILGGDDLSEYYGINNLKRELFRIEEIKDSIDTYLVGQTIGPFDKERINLAKKALIDLPIYSRDPWTTKYLIKDLNLTNITESSDLAFLSLPYQDNKKIRENILLKYNLEEEKYITVIPSGLYKSYCEDKELYIENWKKIISDLKIEYPNKKIVLLPHVLRYSEYDDRNIIKSLQEKIGQNDDIVYIYDEMMPLEARFILGKGVFTITGRMHGAISTLQMRKPAISISYSVKYNGVIGEGLGVSNTIVDGKGIDKWKDFKLAKNVIIKAKEILENSNQINDEINISVTKAEKKAEEMIKEISKSLLNREQ